MSNQTLECSNNGILEYLPTFGIRSFVRSFSTIFAAAAAAAGASAVRRLSDGGAAAFRRRFGGAPAAAAAAKIEKKGWMEMA